MVTSPDVFQAEFAEDRTQQHVEYLEREVARLHSRLLVVYVLGALFAFAVAAGGYVIWDVLQVRISDLEAFTNYR